MLGRFIRLAEAPPEKIREYALQWGALETCEHDMPLWHWGDARCNLVREEDGWSEPLSVWRFYSRNARAVLRVAAEIHEYGHARLIGGVMGATSRSSRRVGWRMGRS
jgi:hypothetical protein